MNSFQRLFQSKHGTVQVSAQSQAGRADDGIGMITEQERAWFRGYAATSYTGAGAIVDLGCFVDSSTIALAGGLRANNKLIDAEVHAYDKTARAPAHVPFVCWLTEKPSKSFCVST
jgi:predicted O-methyltransferase YrrM